MLELYKNIKNRRRELGMSQDVLAKAVGYTDRSSIAKIEAGKIDLPQSKIELFAKVLNTTPAYLMGWEKEEDILIHTDLLISQKALKNLRSLHLVIKTDTGASSMDAFNAIVENNRFCQLMKDVLFQVDNTEEDWRRIADQYNTRYSPTKAISPAQVEKAIFLQVVQDFGLLLEDIVKDGLTPVYDVKKSEEGLELRLKKEDRYLMDLFRNG